MTTSGNVFIVQTAESNQNGRPRGNQIALINKQSALYKYKQQKKQRERGTSLEERQSPPTPTSGTHRSSWLLESRLPLTSPASDDSTSDPESPSLEEGYGRLWLANRGNRPWDHPQGPGVDEDVQLHDCYAGLRTDPFHCMPIENSSTVLSVSDLYTNMMIPHVSQIARVFNVEDVYLDIFWQMVFQEETIDAIVAMSYCVDASWRTPLGPVPKKDIFLHHGKSLANLRQRLSDRDTTNTGITISMLMYNSNVARFLGNIQAVKKHTSMIRHLLKTNPSLASHGFEGKLRPLLLQWDYFLTLDGREEPLVSTRMPYKSEYPSLPLSDEWSDLISTLPTGFKKLAEFGRLSCHLLRVLVRAQEMAAAVAAGTTKAFLAVPNQDPYPDFQAAVPCLDASDNGEAGFERLIVCAIFLLTSRLLSPAKRAIWSLPATGGRAILTEQVFNCQVKNDAEKDCLIWMWLISIDSWGIVSGKLPEKGQLLKEQLKTRYPEASGWSYLSNVVRDFFWTNELETSCETYWEPEL